MMGICYARTPPLSSGLLAIRSLILCALLTHGCSTFGQQEQRSVSIELSCDENSVVDIEMNKDEREDSIDVKGPSVF